MAEQKQSDIATYINVLSWNMQGKSNSWDKIPEFLDKANVDIACLQECGDLTKLIGNSQQKEIEYPYTYPRKDITTKFGTSAFGEIKSKNGQSYGVHFFSSHQALGYQNSMMIMAKNMPIVYQQNSDLIFPAMNGLRPLIGFIDKSTGVRFYNTHLPSGNYYGAAGCFQYQLHDLIENKYDKWLIFGDYNVDPSDIKFVKDWNPELFKTDFGKEPTHDDKTLDYAVRNFQTDKPEINVGGLQSDHKSVVFRYRYK